MAQKAGFKPVGSFLGVSPVLMTFTVGTVAIHYGDLVKFHTDGTILVATGGDAILGVCVTANGASGACAIGSKVEVNVTPGLLVEADAATDVTPVLGVSYDMTGATNAQGVDVAGGANGGMICLQSGVLNGAVNDASMGIFLLQERVLKV